jgi:DNA-binding MarR family transcriptional regulator
MRVIKIVLGPNSHLREEDMDAVFDRRAANSYTDEPPLLVAASSDAAMMRARRAADASGLRVTHETGIDNVRARLEWQPNARALWLELDEDYGGPLDALITRVTEDVAHGRYAAVISATSQFLDPLEMQLEGSEAELIIDADETERAAALAIALAKRAVASPVADIASDRSAERLRQLSEEVGRIAATLSRLSAGPSPVPPVIEQTRTEDVPAVSAETVRSVIRARRLRSRYFAEDLFGDPAWDMLLDLLQAEIAHLRVPVSSLCIAAAVPATTALRWLKIMVGQGLFVRRPDPHDGRRVFVELAPQTSLALRRYFAEVGPTAVI